MITSAPRSDNSRAPNAVAKKALRSRIRRPSSGEPSDRVGADAVRTGAARRSPNRSSSAPTVGAGAVAGGRAVPEAHHGSDLAQRADHRVVDVDDDVGVDDLVVGEHLLGAQHREGGEVGGVEQLDPLVARPGAERLGGEVAGGVVLLVVQRRRHLDPTDIADDVAEAEQVHHPLEPALSPGVDHQVLAVAALEQVGDQAVAPESLLVTRLGQVRLVVLVEPPVHRAHRQRTVEQRRVDELPPARLDTGVERRQHTDHGEEPGDVVDRRMAEEDRSLPMPGLLDHQPQSGGHQGVESGTIAQLAVVARRH